MAPTTDWELTREAAERYEDVLVAGILGPFARSLVEWASIRPGEWVLDIGCGTGAAARAAASKVGVYGRVVGLDSNPAMLEVARSLPAQKESRPDDAGLPVLRPIEWQEGSVDQMALPARVFDLAISAQSFHLLSDYGKALKEIRRVLRPGGRFVFSVWCSLAESPYFNALVKAVSRRLGPHAAARFSADFTLTDSDKIEKLLEKAGFRNILRARNRQDFFFEDLGEFIPRHLSATAVFPAYSEAGGEAQQALVAEAKAELAPLLEAGRGWLAFQSHFLRAYV